VSNADQLYTEAVALCGRALRRLVMGYEIDPDRRRDLLQDIHVELWRSFRKFDGRCSLSTWAYRVAHNVGSSHILRQRRAAERLVDLDVLEREGASVDGQACADQHYVLSALLDSIHRLKPVDRSIILLYLEGESAASIAQTMGATPGHIAVKIHRIKKLLARQFGEGKTHADE
jgi:RNA polymerase sigma-70 factor (ECF subfamily)